MNETELTEEHEYTEESFYGDPVIASVKRSRKTGDIVTTQCNICILLAIVYILLNTFLPVYSDMLAQQYREEASADSPLNEALYSLVEEISTFMNTKPND